MVELGRRLRADLIGDLDEAIWSLEQQVWCALYVTFLRADGVLDDISGAYHGLAADPRFEALLEDRNREVEALQQRLRAEAPWVLKPPNDPT